MEFRACPTREAEGGILAHSLRLGDRRWVKGHVLEADDVNALLDAGQNTVTIARLAQTDMGEADAATTLAEALSGSGLNATPPINGRVNLMADHPGLLQIQADTVHAINALDEGISLATRENDAVLQTGDLAASIKIIPYGLPRSLIDTAVSHARSPGLHLSRFRDRSVRLILTETPGLKPSLLTKARTQIEARLARWDLSLNRVETLPHETGALRDALIQADADLILVLGGSATSDRRDTIPAALASAGGSVTRFGLPVDPGNLLVLGQTREGHDVVGLPGCVRSPAPNGADRILARLAADLPVTPSYMAGLGVGGLIKENPDRATPRLNRGTVDRRKACVHLIVLAAGASRRMQGEDKLLRPIDGTPLLRRSVQTALASAADHVHVVLPDGHTARRAALNGLENWHRIDTRLHLEGIAGSIRAGLAGLPDTAEAVLILPADLPQMSMAAINEVVDAYRQSPDKGVFRAVDQDGQGGHPTLFDRRFFESLRGLEGDSGAQALIRRHREQTCLVRIEGYAATLDLDTPEAWSAYEAQRRP